jgi:hypothetical protein
MNPKATDDGLGAVKLASPEVCQLLSHDAALEPLTPLEHFLRTAKRKARGLLRRMGIIATHPLDARHAPPWRRPVVPVAASSDRGLGSGSGGNGASGDSSRSASPGAGSGDRGGGSVGRRRHLEAGDLVRVKPLEEIMKTLNENRRYKGLQFLHPMADHCGKTYRVLKRVKRIVNDMDHTVKKARGLVILEGVLCHGKGIYGREDCDRTCFFFWKEEWLTRVDEAGRALDEED